MSRRPGAFFPVLAILATVLIYVSLNWTKYARTGSGSTGTAFFHGGKDTNSLKPDPSCVAPQCHAPSPHRKSVFTSAFNNMHQSLVSCLGCHGKDPERRWAPGKSDGGGTIRLVYSPGPGEGVGERRHAANGPPAACRRCHSADGRGKIDAAGVKGLPEGFEDPIALRMIEGGGRKWLPDDMR